MQMQSRWKRVLALLLALVLCLSCAAPALAAETAKTIQMMRAEGTVTVTNASARSMSVREKMRLYSGYSVATKAASYAWVALDDTKLSKLDASSKIELRKAGSSVEILLRDGDIFFNVTEPLTEDESLEIRTSTMVMGIRGTCGWVNRIDPYTTRVSILEGKVECAVVDPATEQRKTAILTAGETADFVVYRPSHPGDKCDVIKDRFGRGDVPGFVLVELVGDAGQCGKIYRESGVDLRDMTQEEAREQLRTDEERQDELLQEILEAEANQERNVSQEPVWPEAPTRRPTTGGGTTPEPEPPATYTVTFDANGGGGTQADGTATAGTPYTPPATTTFTAPSVGKEFAGWGENPTDTEDDAVSSLSVTADLTLYAIWADKTNIALTLAEIQADASALTDALTLGIPVTVSTDAGPATLELDPADVTLLELGNADLTLGDSADAATTISLVLPAGQSLKVGSGRTLTVSGSLTNNLNTTVESTGTLTVAGGLTNAATGTVQVDGTLNVGGATSNSGAIVVTSNTSFHATGLITNVAGASLTANSTGLIDAKGGITNNATVMLLQNGVLQVTGALTNNELVEAQASGAIQVTGDLTNAGTVKAPGTGALTVTGTVANSGCVVDGTTLSVGSDSGMTRAIGLAGETFFGNIDAIVLADGVTDIPASAFAGCKEGATATVPGSVITVGQACFPDQTDVNYAGSRAEWQQLLRSNTTDLFAGPGGTGVGAAGIVTYQCNYGGVLTDNNGAYINWHISTPAEGGYILSFSGRGAIPDGSVGLSTWFEDGTGNGCIDRTNDADLPELITRVELGEGITGLGAYFLSNTSVTTVTIPASVETVTAESFGGAYLLAAVRVAEGNTHLSEADGVLFDLEKTTLLLYPAGKMDVTDYTIPDTVTAIGVGAMWDNNTLRIVRPTTRVVTVGSMGFPGEGWVFVPFAADSIPMDWSGDCGGFLFFQENGEESNSVWYNLDGSELTLAGDGSTRDYSWVAPTDGTKPVWQGEIARAAVAAGILRLGNSVFKDCADLEEVSFLNDSTLAAIGEAAFSGCVKLTELALPDTVASIGAEAFSGCTGLTSITLSKTLTSIGDDAFRSCGALAHIYFTGTAAEWNSWALRTAELFKGKTIHLMNNTPDDPEDDVTGTVDETGGFVAAPPAPTP